MGHVHYSMQWFTLQSSSSPVSMSKALCTPGRSVRGTSRNWPMRAGPWWAEVTLRGAPLTGDPGEEPRRPASAEGSLSRGHLVTGSSVSKRLCPCLPGTGLWIHCTLILANYSSWNWYKLPDWSDGFHESIFQKRICALRCKSKKKILFTRQLMWNAKKGVCIIGLQFRLSIVFQFCFALVRWSFLDNIEAQERRYCMKLCGVKYSRWVDLSPERRAVWLTELLMLFSELYFQLMSDSSESALLNDSF